MVDMLETPMIRVLLHRSSKILQHRPFYSEENCIQVIYSLVFPTISFYQRGISPGGRGEHFHIGPVGGKNFSKSSRTGNSKAYDFTEHVKFPGQIYPKGSPNSYVRVKIAHSFLQSVSDQFHVIILSLPT